MQQEYKPPQNDKRYFIIGKNIILISEHFCTDGKTVDSILEKVIMDSVKMPENRINP